MIFEKVKLKDICSSISDGDHQAPPKATKGVPFVTITNITNTNQFDFSNTMFVPQEYYDGLDSKRRAQEGDILYSVVGSFGIPVYIKEATPFVFQRHIAILKPNADKIVPGFLYYTMLNRDFYMKADAVALGAAQRTISLTALRNMEIEIPHIEVQKKIVKVLSSYDNLIENNQKQIKLLEEAAQRLYKEWFVDLRFPEHEDVAIVDGVPEGWKQYFLSEIVGYEIGGGWGEEFGTEKCDKPAYVIRGTDLYGITHGVISEVPYRFHAASNLKSRQLIDGDIIFEVSGGSKTEGVARTTLIRNTILHFLREPIMCASFCKLVRAKEKIHSQLLFDTFQYMRASGKTGEYDKKSASSIVNYRWKDFLAQETILIPNEDLLIKYNALSENMYQLILTKSVEIEKTKEARDRLLPKLMSGEIEV